MAKLASGSGCESLVRCFVALKEDTPGSAALRSMLAVRLFDISGYPLMSMTSHMKDEAKHNLDKGAHMFKTCLRDLVLGRDISYHNLKHKLVTRFGPAVFCLFKDQVEPAIIRIQKERKQSLAEKVVKKRKIALFLYQKNDEMRKKQSRTGQRTMTSYHWIKDQVIKEFGEAAFLRHKVFVTDELRRYNSSAAMLNDLSNNCFRRLAVRQLVCITQFLDVISPQGVQVAFVNKKFYAAYTHGSLWQMLCWNHYRHEQKLLPQRDSFLSCRDKYKILSARLASWPPEFRVQAGRDDARMVFVGDASSKQLFLQLHLLDSGLDEQHADVRLRVLPGPAWTACAAACDIGVQISFLCVPDTSVTRQVADLSCTEGVVMCYHSDVQGSFDTVRQWFMATKAEWGQGGRVVCFLVDCRCDESGSEDLFGHAADEVDSWAHKHQVVHIRSSQHDLSAQVVTFSVFQRVAKARKAASKHNGCVVS